MINLQRLYNEDIELFNSLLSNECKVVSSNGIYEGYLDNDMKSIVVENSKCENPKNMYIIFNVGKDQAICNFMNSVQENAYSEFEKFVEGYDGDIIDACKDFKTLNKIVAIGAKLPNYIESEEFPESIKLYIKKYGTPIANFYEALTNYTK